MGACSTKLDLLDADLQFDIADEKLSVMLTEKDKYNKRSRQALKKIISNRLAQKKDVMPDLIFPEAKESLKKNE